MAEIALNKLIIIASSTGGPRALRNLLPSIEADLDAPIIIVQHMPKGFTNSLAKRLDRTCKVNVHEAYDGHVLENGNVYIARGGTHLVVKQKSNGELYFYEDDSEPINGLKPCADLTFSSIADLKINHILCCVLTGMGSDGCVGLEQIKQHHDTYVIAQSKESCVVYGMPKSIVEHGLADKILPIEEIGEEINKKARVL